MTQKEDNSPSSRLRNRLSSLKSRYRIPVYNIGYKLAGSLDGYPLPPARLVDFIIGTKEIAWYQLGGLFMAQGISTFLRRNGTPVESYKAILDFGCGCGRILRWWAALRDQTEIWGSDYNEELISWCQNNLADIAQFKVNDSTPPLEFPDEKFDLIYAYSVFTHFAVDLQHPWMAELARVLKPGGSLLITVHGERVAWRSGFSDQQLKQFDEEGILTFGEEQSGSNYCAAYHSEKYMSNQRSLGLELVDFMSGGVRDASEQDMYLYHKIDYTSV
jgi:SAM-dependent methyltransferase